MENIRKRPRELDNQRGGTAGSTLSTTPRRAQGYSLQGDEFQPCLTPSQRAVPLDFNFWMSHRYISDAEVHEFLSSVLLDNHHPEFIGNTWKDLPKSKRVIFVSFQGLSPVDLSLSIANSGIPILNTFTSVPVRHSISLSLSVLPSTPNITSADNFWRYSDAILAQSLLFWPVIPAATYQEVNSFRNQIFSLFSKYRLVFMMTQSADTLGELTFVSYQSNESSLIGKVKRLRLTSESPSVDFGLFSLSPISEGMYNLTLTFPNSEPIKFESTVFLTDGQHSSESPTPLSLVFLSTSKLISKTETISCEDGEEIEENQIIFEKEDPNRIVLSLTDVKCEKFPSNSWKNSTESQVTALPEVSSSSSNNNSEEYWRKLKDMFEKCLELSHQNQFCFDDFLSSPYLFEMMGYITQPSDTPPAASHLRQFRYRSTGDEKWKNSLAVESSKKSVKSDKNLVRVKVETVVVVQKPAISNLYELLEDGEESEEENDFKSKEIANNPLVQLETVQIDEQMEVAQIVNPEELSLDQEEGEDGPIANITYVPKLFPKNNRLVGNVRAICAIDCEMCETSLGNELTRLSIICPVDGIIFDELVKPRRPITDYNTQYSGITETMMKKVSTTFDDIMKILPSYIGPDTILVGHSLESDLNILGLCHHRIIDTVSLFPHPSGLPYKKSLKQVAKEYLHRDIQTDKVDPIELSGEKQSHPESPVGHDSIEDASITLELVFTRVIEHYAQRLESSKMINSHKYLPSIWLTLPPLLNNPSSNQNVLPNSANNSERYTLFHSLLSSVGNIDCKFHLCESYRHIAPWERYSMGYRSDSYVDLVYDQFQQDDYLSEIEKRKIQVDIQHHTSVSDAVTHAIESISSSSPSSQFIWVDMPCNLDSTAQPLRSCQGDCLNTNEIQSHLSRIVAGAHSGDVVCVLTQGDLMGVRRLMAYKQRLRWLDAALKSGTSSPFMQGYYTTNNFAWSTTNEEDLIRAAACAIAGSFYIKYIS